VDARIAPGTLAKEACAGMRRRFDGDRRDARFLEAGAATDGLDRNRLDNDRFRTVGEAEPGAMRGLEAGAQRLRAIARLPDDLDG